MAARDASEEIQVLIRFRSSSFRWTNRTPAAFFDGLVHATRPLVSIQSLDPGKRKRTLGSSSFARATAAAMATPPSPTLSMIPPLSFPSSMYRRLGTASLKCRRLGSRGTLPDSCGVLDIRECRRLSRCEDLDFRG